MGPKWLAMNKNLVAGLSRRVGRASRPLISQLFDAITLPPQPPRLTSSNFSMKPASPPCLTHRHDQNPPHFFSDGHPAAGSPAMGVTPNWPVSPSLSGRCEKPPGRPLFTVHLPAPARGTQHGSAPSCKGRRQSNSQRFRRIAPRLSCLSAVEPVCSMSFLNYDKRRVPISEGRFVAFGSSPWPTS